MKKILYIAFLLICSFANAGEVILRDEAADFFSFKVKSEFQIDESRDKAWIKLTIDSGERQSSPEFEIYKVAGMAFDKTTQEVYLETATGRVVCALQKRGLLRIKRIYETGNCSIKSSIYTESNDDGVVRKLKVSLFY